MVEGDRSQQDALYLYFSSIMRNFDYKLLCSFQGVYLSLVLFNSIKRTRMPFGHLIQE